MASSCRCASTAASPRHPSFSPQRRMKSEREQLHECCLKKLVRPLTQNPSLLVVIYVRFIRQFAQHLLQTLNRVRYVVDRFEMLAYDPINCKSRSHKLQSVMSARYTRVRGILTLIAADTAFFHKPLANVAFAHSRTSGAGIGESRVSCSVGTSSCGVAFEAASPPLPGAERHR